MIRFSEASIEALIDPKGYDCACGRHHQMKMDYIKIGPGAIASIPEGLAAMGVKRPFDEKVIVQELLEEMRA